MQRALVVGSGVILILHGLVHLMGTTVYMKLGRIEGLPYKTTLLRGRWETGEQGTRLFGAIWVLPALGFVIGGSMIIGGSEAWVPLIVAMTLLSLVLTVLDWQVAFAGAIVNVAILVVVLLARRFGG